MGAIGFTLIIITILRALIDEPKYLPMPQAAKWKWGLATLVGIALCVASIFKLLWEYMP